MSEPRHWLPSRHDLASIVFCYSLIVAVCLAFGTTVEPMMSYTSALTRRMQATGWKTTDSFYVHAHRAHDALHAMRMLAHYAVCGLGGAGRPGEPPKG